jgi:imidazoleglycerol phosphate dehydratase HisB
VKEKLEALLQRTYDSLGFAKLLLDNGYYDPSIMLSGINDHHKAEALFEPLARAPDSATRIDERILGRVPSTKEIIKG